MPKPKAFSAVTANHFTTAAYIVSHKKLLLVLHPKFNKWMPPGGHVEKNESPDQTVKRETIEETGWQIEFYPKQSKLKKKLEEQEARIKLAPVPWQVLIEKITDTHYHIDFLYLANPTKKTKAKEDSPTKWFSVRELNKLKNIFPNVKYFGKKAIKLAKER